MRHRPSSGRLVPAWLALAAIVAGGGCYPVNRPLERFDETAGYRWATVVGDSPAEDETFVVVTMSGGGTRAAAFGYGVLKELSETRAPHGDLLDDVDVVSSVSGGSFAAAYLGVFGKERFLAEFPKRVLYRKLEVGYALRLLAPWNWPRLLSPAFGRSDIADEYYGSTIFGNKTFGDLMPHRPFIVLNATDIGRGAQFSFTQDDFDRLCSDLSRVQVSRGVTASSAFPVVFTPLTLKNYGARRCLYDPPDGIRQAAAGDMDADPQRWDLARTWGTYDDASRRPYIHLSDGGLSDNIGLRPLPTNAHMSEVWTIYPKAIHGLIKRFVVIVVDAKPRSDSCADRSARPPGLFTVLDASASTPMENYSSDTIENVRHWFKDQWAPVREQYCAQRRQCRGLAPEICRKGDSPCQRRVVEKCYATFDATKPPPAPELYEIHVRFDAIPDCSVRGRLQGVGTRLQLPRDQVDLLVDWGARLLRDAPDFQRLRRSLDAPGVPPSFCPDE
jgi:NTE family protein